MLIEFNKSESSSSTELKSSKFWNKKFLKFLIDLFVSSFGSFEKKAVLNSLNIFPKLEFDSFPFEKIESFKKEHQKPASTQQNQSSPNSGMPQLGGDESWQIPVNVVRQIRNSKDLQTCLDIFLENLPEEKPDIKEAYSFTMTLPEQYYGVGSYDKWIKTGFALKNINIYLLIVWLKFSSQSKTFDYSIHVDEICDHWTKFSHNPINGVKKKSLMYWSRI